MSSNDSRGLYPVLAMLVGAGIWGIVWYPMRLLEAGGLGGLWLTLTLYVSASAASLPYTASSVREFMRSPISIALLIFSAGWTNVAFVQAVLDGNVLRVMLLFYLAPLWATLMGRLFLRESISRRGLASLALAMFGALVMLWRADLGAPWPHGRVDWLALSAGFAFALSTVATRKMHDVSVAAKVLCVWIGVVVVALAMIGLLGVALPRPSLSVFGGAVLLGIVGMLATTVLVQYGVTHLPVHRSAVLALIELVAGAASQQLLTDELVSVREWVGGILIAVGAYLAARAPSAKDF